MRVTSDPRLLAEIREDGVFNPHGCFACGSCTLVCDLAADTASFPRRTMQSVVLGLREEILQGLEPWLCHDCGDCSTTCPRDADPRHSMMTLRRYLTGQYDWTGIAARVSRSAAFEMSAIGFVSLLVLALIVLYHLTIEKLDISVFRSTAMGLQHMFPRILYFTWAVFLIPGFFNIFHAYRMYRFTMRGRGIPFRCYVHEAKAFLASTFGNVEILKCAAGDRKVRWTVHWLMAFGCVLMFVVKFFFLKWFQTDRIYAIYHPQRWLGYLGAAFLLAGAVDFIVAHLRELQPASSRRRALMLPTLLLLTALSGLAVHILRYTGFALAAHYAYALHLMIAVPLLVVEIPFGHWSHMLYRPMAVYFSAVRARALEQKAKEALAA